MTMNLYVIYDRLACESGPVFEAKNDSLASRAAMQMLRDQNINEFKMLKIGWIDHEINIVNPVNPPKMFTLLGKL